MQAPLSSFDDEVFVFFEFQVFNIVLNFFHLNFVLQHIAYFIYGVSDIKNPYFLVKFEGVVLKRGKIFSVMMPIFDKFIGVVAFPLDLTHSVSNVI